MSENGWAFWQSSQNGTAYPTRMAFNAASVSGSDYDVVNSAVEAIHVAVNAYRNFQTGADLQTGDEKQMLEELRKKQNGVIIAVRNLANMCATRFGTTGKPVSNAIRIDAADEFYAAIVKNAIESYSMSTFKKRFVPIFFSRLFGLEVKIEVKKAP